MNGCWWRSAREPESAAESARNGMFVQVVHFDGIPVPRREHDQHGGDPQSGIDPHVHIRGTFGQGSLQFVGSESVLGGRLPRRRLSGAGFSRHGSRTQWDDGEVRAGGSITTTHFFHRSMLSRSGTSRWARRNASVWSTKRIGSCRRCSTTWSPSWSWSTSTKPNSRRRFAASSANLTSDWPTVTKSTNSSTKSNIW